MSIKLIRDVLAYAPADLTTAERLVLLTLAEDARDDRLSRYASRTRLIAATGLSGSSVKRALRGLEDAALIFRRGGAYRGHVQEYVIAELAAHHQATTVHPQPADPDPQPADIQPVDMRAADIQAADPGDGSPAGQINGHHHQPSPHPWARQKPLPEPTPKGVHPRPP